jgi:hypothetical protein
MNKLITGLMLAALAGLWAPRKAVAANVTATSGNASLGVAAGATQDSKAMIKDWSQASQAAAQNMLDRYGQPDVVSASMLAWKNKAPFTKIVVMRDGVRHLFPSEHQDVLLEEISLAVPIDKLSELAKFDGSLLVDRTKGTLAARGDTEASNFLALNLADDIINGKRDADNARAFFADTLAKQASGKSSSYTSKLNFTVSGDTSYPDMNAAPGTSSPSPSVSPDSQDISNPGTPETTPPDNGTKTDDMKKGE